MIKIKDQTTQLAAGLTLREMIFRDEEGVKNDVRLIGLGPLECPLTIKPEVSMSCNGPIAEEAPLGTMGGTVINDAWGFNDKFHDLIGKDLAQTMSWRADVTRPLQDFIDAWNKRVHWVMQRRQDTKAAEVK